jgi:hypothetical protein
LDQNLTKLQVGLVERGYRAASVAAAIEIYLLTYFS